MRNIVVLQNRYQHHRLNQQQTLSYQKLREVMHTFHQQRAWQASANTPEPAEYHPEALELLSSSQKSCDFWLFTSGYQFSLEKALALKKAGLVGVVLSLHHFDPEEHNNIQGYKHAYGWVLKAADSIRKAGLLLCLRLNPTPGFINMHNLLAYARLAQQLGVSLIQITEKDEHGNFSHHEYSLQAHHLLILDDFIEALNYDQNFKNWPVVSFHAPSECMSAKGSLYVDADGRLVKAS